jgi:hypothetical protein
MEQALAIDKEVQSRHVIWPVSGDLQSRIKKAINENKPWHSLVIDQVLSGKTTSAITAKTSPGSYAISEKTKKEYFDAILNQGQSGPWALAVAPDGCARRYQSMTLWNSKWSALRKCKKDCKSEACQILYVYKTRQPLGEAGNDSESTVASKRSLESVKVITLLERDKRVVGKLIFLASNHLVTRYLFWSSEKEEFFLEDAIFTNLREKTPVYRENHSAYPENVVVLPGGKAVGFFGDDAVHVAPVEGCCEKKYEIKDWTAGEWDFGGLLRVVPAGYEAFYEADTSGFILTYFGSLFHFDGEHLTSLGRQVGSGLGGVISSASPAGIEVFRAPGRQFWFHSEEYSAEIIKRRLPFYDKKMIEGFRFLYDAQAFFSAGFEGPATQKAQDAVKILATDPAALLIAAGDLGGINWRFPYSMGLITNELIKSQTTKPLEVIDAYVNYVTGALLGRQYALAMAGAARGIVAAEQICPTLKTQKEKENCAGQKKAIYANSLLARLEAGEITADEIFDEMGLDETIFLRIYFSLVDERFGGIGNALRQAPAKMAFLMQQSRVLEYDNEEAQVEAEQLRKGSHFVGMASAYVDLAGEFVPAPKAPQIRLAPTVDSQPAGSSPTSTPSTGGATLLE